ncbi:HAMP domain-containing histidine kinase [Streptomyces sp. NBC_00190]|uniref:sensor histidine kinase n=1 Tax=unclassified Streptomyces TaxID=2593676 RepID=UPI002E28E272|nr:HAMP domain-containing sensor histidine kinase [Streptomyces sp. NBC_00190]WSZ41187.1 HAMP domain-containing histidine kinase [Streptomyces sp. NBC_00868]
MAVRLRPKRPGRPWSLRTRLVVSAVALIAVVGAAIGTVTTLALRLYLVNNLDDQLRISVGMASSPPGVQKAIREGRSVLGPGTPLGAVGFRIDSDGKVLGAYRSVRDEDPERRSQPLTEAQTAVLAKAARTAEQGRSAPVNLSLPGLGSYRVLPAPDGSLVLGFPLHEVDSTVNTLVAVEVCVTLAGLIAASLAGQALVGVALRPLRRVAATATRVSELPLHSGEPALHERVRAAEADPRTEVGQVGAALNRMLGHVSSALTARQQSEMRVRQFVADASHELRTPLASIRGYAELTRRGREEPGPDTRHALGRIESEATRMTGLVEDLLLLARLDAGRPLSTGDTDTDLAPLVVDAVSDARAAGPEHHWRLRLPDEPVPVRVDPARIQQVLVNLLANARTHTPPGTTVTAHVSLAAPAVAPAAARAAAAGGETSAVRLLIEDDGPGIPPDLLPHVFERFARGDASRSRAAGSTGLGLAIVQAVVTAHGGRVGVRSEPGRTCFEVLLPHAHAHAHTDPDSRTDSRTDSHTDSQTGHRLITQR